MVEPVCYFDNKISHAYPLVEALWCNLGSNVKNAVVSSITNQVPSAIVKELDVALYFHVFQDDDYDNNRQH
ncbi:DUF1904 family protein [Vibrio thalassae]|uniref:DUF1904 family protein n=1 Tax=Vibrio thalassae TaxID=1243014 RepID=UPI00362A804B